MNSKTKLALLSGWVALLSVSSFAGEKAEWVHEKLQEYKTPIGIGLSVAPMGAAGGYSMRLAGQAESLDKGVEKLNAVAKSIERTASAPFREELRTVEDRIVGLQDAIQHGQGNANLERLKQRLMRHQERKVVLEKKLTEIHPYLSSGKTGSLLSEADRAHLRPYASITRKIEAETSIKKIKVGMLSRRADAMLGVVGLTSVLGPIAIMNAYSLEESLHEKMVAKDRKKAQSDHQALGDSDREPAGYFESGSAL